MVKNLCKVTDDEKPAEATALHPTMEQIEGEVFYSLILRKKITIVFAYNLEIFYTLISHTKGIRYFQIF